MTRREQGNTRCQTHPNTGRHSTHHRHSTKATEQTAKGERRHQRGEHQHADGRVNAAAPALQHMPPFPRHATPPSTMPPHHPRREGGDRGYPTTRTAQTHTHHPHTTHLAENSARHDSSTHQYRTGSRWHGPHALGWGGPAAAHTTAIQQQHIEERRTPSTHPLTLFTFTYSTINIDQRTTINH